MIAITNRKHVIPGIDSPWVKHTNKTPWMISTTTLFPMTTCRSVGMAPMPLQTVCNSMFNIDINEISYIVFTGSYDAMSSEWHNPEGGPL